ncbi:uncharacterized protein LOC144356528 [Saccoglossus kowalevskii]
MSPRCQAAFGRSCTGKRLVSVLLKDVAGLVPGAADGKGRGNRFLSDLCDADVLIHIIDISGRTDEKGEEAIGYDPANDVKWLLNDKIHRWIYDNIMNKWDIIVKRPPKLLDMFTGYHANRPVIQATFTNAGIDTRELPTSLPLWTDPANVINNLVKEFIKLRFPMLPVLNKSDAMEAEKNIARFQELFPETPMMPVSALSECYLIQSLVKDNHIQYELGSAEFRILQDVDGQQGISERLEMISTTVWIYYGNVYNALNLAVSLKPPVYAYPVQDLNTLKFIDSSRYQDTGVLRDCVLLKPGTTVDEFYNVILHTLCLVSGKFVRAETIDRDGNKRQIRKVEIIKENNNVKKLMTTRKS